MPQDVGSIPLGLNETSDDECRHIPLNCPWTITPENESLTVIITCLKWIFSFDFCVRVTAQPQGSPNVSKQRDLEDHHPLLRSSNDKLNL